MTPSFEAQFKCEYKTYLQHPKLKGLKPKTIDALRRISPYFNYQLHDLSEAQLLDYFTHLLERLSWSAVKLDPYGLKFSISMCWINPGIR